MVKLAPRGHAVLRHHLGYYAVDTDNKRELTAADFGMPTEAAATGTGADKAGGAASATAAAVPAVPSLPNINLFADSFVPSFFRYYMTHLFSIEITSPFPH
jgi:hypothetical protein